MTDEELLSALDELRTLMIDVATGGPRINDVNGNYQRVFAGVAADLARRRIDNPITFGNRGRHPPLDDVNPGPTDAKRMLDAYIAVELGGGANEEARRHARSALDFAVALQHRRTASFRDAALCAEATTAVINVIAKVAGRRDPQ